MATKVILFYLKNKQTKQTYHIFSKRFLLARSDPRPRFGAEKSINQSINQLINQSINQLFNQSTKQPMNQSIYQPINKLII
jgi:hypothetical protein